METLIKFGQSFGWEKDGSSFMWILAICLIFAIALIIERWIYLVRKANINAPKFMLEVTKLITANKIDKAIELCDAAPEAALPRLVKKGLQNAGTDQRTIQNAVDETGLEVLPQLQKRTGYIAMVSQISTLLGLMGTIYGLILSFDAVGRPGIDPALKSTLLAQGISTAMFTTLFGLVIAVPAIVFYTIFTQKITKITDDIDEHSVKLINLLASRR